MQLQVSDLNVKKRCISHNIKPIASETNLAPRQRSPYQCVRFSVAYSAFVGV
jgi:hypothetical protein